MRLSDFARSEFSQFGQDGVVETIHAALSKLVARSRYFVEFGSSGDDKGTGNTPNLRRHGWDGLLMDKDHQAGAVYEIHQEKITAGNIESLFVKYKVPKRFGFLSIDIDGQDYWVWDAIKNWLPDIVCIESNHYVGHEPLTVPLNDDFQMTNAYYFGASRRALLELGLRKGYTLVAICVTDMIFVRDALNPDFENMNNILALDTARTDRWVSRPIAEEVARQAWVRV